MAIEGEVNPRLVTEGPNIVRVPGRVGERWSGTKRASEETRVPAVGVYRRRIVAVIPAYNEDRFVGSVVLKTRGYVDEVVVVDDGSIDETAQIARNAGAYVIPHLENRGKAAALRTGFKYACSNGATVIVMLDGDGQHDPASIPAVTKPILDGSADMVIGSRFLGIKSAIPAWRQFGQHVLTTITNVSAGVSCTDSQTGFRAFSAEALKTFDIRCSGFTVESEMQFWASEQHLRLVEVPIGCVYAEKAKRNPIRHGLHVVDGILSLVSQSRPLLFFGSVGLALVCAGVVWGGLVIAFANGSGSLDIMQAVGATLLLVIGALMAFEGVELHVLRKLMLQLPTRTLAEQTRSKAARGRAVAKGQISGRSV